MKAAIRHLIVLMLENRSFDHLLGYLEYPPEKGFEGIKGKESAFGNLLNNGIDCVYPDEHAEYLVEPDPDHSHASVMTQLFGLDWRKRKGNQATNTGFGVDYEHKKNAVPEKVLQCFTPDQVPVLSTLAQEFAVCDHWFCSVPGATWPNRNFAHAATSDGLVDIETRTYSNNTIFERLTQAGKDWTIYYGGFPPQAFAFSALWTKRLFPWRPSWFQRFKPVQNLYRAIQTDHLPHYAFVEPDMFGLISDSQHPGMGGERDFRAAELLVWTIYEALRARPEVFEKTLFLITYDEHGGFFDHVPPPHGWEWKVRPLPRGDYWVSRDPEKDYCFDFDLLGPRVPAVLVSPWIERGTVDHTIYDHASIPATVRELFGPFEPLTTRDENANTFAHEGNFSRDLPRRQDLPVIAKPEVYPPVRAEMNKLELRDSLMDLLKITWGIIRDQPGDFLSRLLGRPEDLKSYSPADDAILPDEVKGRIFAEIVPELSPQAQQLLFEANGDSGFGTYSDSSPESATNREAAGHSQSRIARALEVFQDFLAKLEDDDRVDDIQKFVETVLYRYYQDPNFILRNEEDRAVLKPKEMEIKSAIQNLYGRGVPGSRIWLVDEMDRWLTLYSDGRLVFDDLEEHFEVRQETEARALLVFRQMLKGDVQGVRRWFELGGPVEGPDAWLERAVLPAEGRPQAGNLPSLPISGRLPSADKAPVIGELPPEEIARRLEAMGDAETAAEIRGGGSDESSFEGFGLGAIKPWQFMSQQIGFLPLFTEDSPAILLVQPVGSIRGDSSLKNAKIDIKLDLLNIIDYPGRGAHQVMIVFKAQNQLSQGAEPVSFSQIYSVQPGGAASIAGYPVFLGLNTGSNGVAFEIYTINVKNEDDQALLGVLESGTFRGGLDLLAGFQPAVKPFTEIVSGLASSFLRRSENVKVQQHYLGLDFSSAPLGARLAEGNYVVAQVPTEASIRWAEWVFDRSEGTIVRDDPSRSPLPYNYLVFRVEHPTKK